MRAPFPFRRKSKFLFSVDICIFDKVRKVGRFIAFGDRYLAPIFVTFFLTADFHKSIF